MTCCLLWTRLGASKLVNEAQTYDALVVRSEIKVTERLLNAGAGKFKAIGRAGAGVDNIKAETATKNNVDVLNTPGGNSVSACELACILIGALARPVCPAAESNKKKQGAWSRNRYGGT